jgi:hypothetical protein
MTVPTCSVQLSLVQLKQETQLNRIQSVEMLHLRAVKGCTRLDHIKKTDIFLKKETKMKIHSAAKLSTKYEVRR